MSILISSDSHINEPPGLWQDNISDPAIKDKAPSVLQTDAGDAWLLKPGTAPRAVSSSAYAGLGWQAIAAGTVTYKSMRPGSFDPVARLEDMDIDGIAAEVLYPGVGRYLAQFEDEETRARCASVYNDWMGEFQSAAPDRLVGLATLPPLVDGRNAIEELRRVSSMGFRGAFLACTQDPAGIIGPPEAEDFWREAGELGIPVSLHIGSGGANLSGGHGLAGTRGFAAIAQSRRASVPMSIAPLLSALLLSGVLNRYRGLRIVIAESGIGWLPFLVNRLDAIVSEGNIAEYGETERLPSEIFKDQVYATFQDDEIGLELRRHLGASSLMWASDYPHTDTTWPESRAVVDRNFKDVGADDKEAIVWRNCAGLYGLTETVLREAAPVRSAAQ